MANGLPELLMLPGLDGTGDLFWRLDRVLDARIRRRIIRYPANDTLGYDELTEFVKRQIGGAPVVILGESFSGPIAVRLAAQDPAMVCGIVLAATFLTAPYAPALVELTPAIGPNRLSYVLTGLLLMGFARDEDLEQQLTDIIEKLPVKVRAKRLREVAGIDARQDLQAVTCPVLGLHGASDWLVPRRPLERALATKPQSRMKVLAGPHMLLQRNPQDAAREIEAFIDKVGSSA